MKQDRFKSFIGESKIVYSLSDVRNLVDSTIRSIRSLNYFIDKDDIIVFYTPPRSKNVFNKLSKISNVIKAKNITDPFMFQKNRFGSYGEKIHLCEVDEPNIIFINSDTLVLKNPRELFVDMQYEYDVSSRVGLGYLDFDFNIWNKMFERIDKKPIPMLNTGFLVFMDFTHKKIMDEWLEYINMELDNPHPTSYMKDQYAFSLAVSGLRIRYMDKNEHSFLWNKELNDTCVRHGSINLTRIIKRDVVSWFKYAVYKI